MQINLTGIPETMLWTLHNRAAEAVRTDGCLRDPEAVHIYRTIQYDYEKSFGPAEPSHAVRSVMFDEYLRRFLEVHPNGVIVNLGEGLETQRYRVDRGEELWLSVDLADAMAVRERFIASDERHQHVDCSALDEKWYDAVPSGRPVYITAQGLLMYFDEQQVRDHLMSLAERFPGAWYAFDTVPRWLSRKSTSARGWWKTPRYQVPPVPWGINQHEIEPTLRDWVPTLQEIKVCRYDKLPRGAISYIFLACSTLPLLKRITPSVTRIRFDAKGNDQ